MVANARAIARAAVLALDDATKTQFSKLADDLEAAMYERLWDPDRKFFVCRLYPGLPLSYTAKNNC